jgi:hypothetical protein
MPKPSPSSTLLLRIVVRALEWLAVFPARQRSSLKMTICLRIRNRPENFNTRKRGETGFARCASPMPGTLPVMMMGKANNHEHIQTCCCREPNILCSWRGARRNADRPASDSQNSSPRSRYVDGSGPSPACSPYLKCSAFSMRHHGPALQPSYQTKPAFMSRRDYLGGSCGCECNSGYKNGPTLNSSQSKEKTNSHRVSSQPPTAPVTLQ